MLIVTIIKNKGNIYKLFSKETIYIIIIPL